MLNITSEAAKCLLCGDGACAKACPKAHAPDRMLRAVRFENEKGAAKHVKKDDCKNCAGFCETACIHYDTPVRIRQVAQRLPDLSPNEPSVSLAIDFLGKRCENPFFLSSSIVAGGYDMVARAFEMGWAGVVYKTVGFSVPKEVSPRFDAIGKEGTPFIGFKNLEQISDVPLRENLLIFERLKKNYPHKVVVASILGETAEEWADLSKAVTDAGVDMIECNFSCPHMSAEGLGSDVGQNPDLVAAFTKAVKDATHLPVIAKMTPNVGNIEPSAVAAVKAGADCLAAINTVKSITGLDLETMTPKMSVEDKSSVSGYSGKAVKPIALRFIHDMYKCPDIKNTPLSGMGGIETWRDALEFIALGCCNVQVTTAIMQYGYRIIDDLKDGLAGYMWQKGVKNLQSLVGSAAGNLVSANLLNRETVVYPLPDKEKCIGCKRCGISCRDAGHGAIDYDYISGRPAVNGKKCAGCLLCALVCPVGAITHSKRISKHAKGV